MFQTLVSSRRPDGRCESPSSDEGFGRSDFGRGLSPDELLPRMTYPRPTSKSKSARAPNAARAGHVRYRNLDTSLRGERFGGRRDSLVQFQQLLRFVLVSKKFFSGGTQSLVLLCGISFAARQLERRAGPNLRKTCQRAAIQLNDLPTQVLDLRKFTFTLLLCIFAIEFIRRFALGSSRRIPSSRSATSSI